MNEGQFDTESADSPNLFWYGRPGSPAVIAFTGMARGLNELANFEFVKTTAQMPVSKVFVRDPHFCFYHRGIDANCHSIPGLRTQLSLVLEECSPTRLVCLGVSAGGFAALLFGHLLGADKVHAFGPQTVLLPGEFQDHTVETSPLQQLSLSEEDDFRDLRKLLATHNGKTSYNIHIGRDRCDELHAQALENLPGVHEFFDTRARGMPAPLTI